MSLSSEERVLALEVRMSKTERWSAEHDGWINTEWKNQHCLNRDMKEANLERDRRLGVLEKRVVLLSAGAALIGAMAGRIIEARMK